MKILICGDTVINKDISQYFESGDLNHIFDKALFDVFCDKNIKLRVLNLECPLTNNNQSISKCGPVLKGPVGSVVGLKKINIDLVSLANNHAYDFGLRGLIDTMDVLKKNKIDYFGIRDNNSYFFKKIDNKLICFYSVAENEFSTIRSETPSINGLNAHRTLFEIKDLKRKCDVLIVLFHGGMELYKYPTPNQLSICRSFVDFGADFVVCQHSHCVGCMEKYKGKIIVYGQGNFVFFNNSIEEYKEILLILLDIHEDNSITCSFIPAINNQKIIMKKENAMFLDDFFQRSKEIQYHREVVDKQYRIISLKKKYSLLYDLFGYSKLLSSIDNNILSNVFLKRSIRKNKKLMTIWLNLLRCETHKELVEQILKECLNIE